MNLKNQSNISPGLQCGVCNNHEFHECPPIEFEQEPVIVRKTRNYFPIIGTPNTLYVATEENKIYRWSDSDLMYFSLGGGTGNVKVIYGGNAYGLPDEL